MKRIYKYGPVYINGYTEIYGKLIYAGLQNDNVYVWCELSEENEFIKNRVRIVGTGHLYNGCYFATVIDGEYVWHVIKED